MHDSSAYERGYDEGWADGFDAGAAASQKLYSEAFSNGRNSVRTLNDWCHLAHGLAVNKGWYDPPPDLGTRIALIHSELSELLEAFRKGVPDHVRADGKPEGPASEIADVFIRLADLCGWLGIDLQKAVEQKHAFNRVRGYRHGGLPF